MFSKLFFHPGVQAEIKAAYTWYQDKAAGLGDDFIHELESSFGAIVELPQTWPKFKKNFRRFLLSRFPFSVIYRQQGAKIFVVAVMHQSKKPNYWLQRITQQ